MKTLALLFGLASIALLPACSGDDGNPPPVDSPAIDSAGSDGPAPVCTADSPELLTTCTDGSTCGGCECRMVGHMKYCSKTCTDQADCPAAATCFEGYCVMP